MTDFDETRQRILDLPLTPDGAAYYDPIAVTRFDGELESRRADFEDYAKRSVLMIGSLTERCMLVVLRLLKEAGVCRPLTAETAWQAAKEEYVANLRTIHGEHFDGSVSLLREKFGQAWRSVQMLVDENQVGLAPLNVPAPEAPTVRLQPQLVDLQLSGSGSGHGVVELNGHYWFARLTRPFEPVDPSDSLLRPEQFRYSDFALDTNAEAQKTFASPVDLRLRVRDVDLLIDLLHGTKPGECLTAEVAWYHYLTAMHPHGVGELNRSLFDCRMLFAKAWYHMKAALDELDNSFGDGISLHETYSKP